MIIKNTLHYCMYHLHVLHVPIFKFQSVSSPTCLTQKLILKIILVQWHFPHLLVSYFKCKLTSARVHIIWLCTELKNISILCDIKTKNMTVFNKRNAIKFTAKEISAHEQARCQLTHNVF